MCTRRTIRIPRQRGSAMLLVMVSVAIAMIITVSYVSSQGTSTAIAANVTDNAQARAIAQAALDMAAARIAADNDWRSGAFEGPWIIDQALAGGDFTVELYDGDERTGDGSLSNDNTDNVFVVASGTYNGVTHETRAVVTPAASDGNFEIGVANVAGTPIRINTRGTYISPVVVCTVAYANNTRPVVARIDSVTSDGFDLWLENPSGRTVAADAVHWIVMEEGEWEVDGIKYEAVRFNSTVTDHNRAWTGENVTYGHEYENPVVIGQVMSSNDDDWSVFWCRGRSRGHPPSSGELWIGKTVCEDPDRTRADETLGYIVFEQGRHTIAGVAIDAQLSADRFIGVTSSPRSAPFLEAFTTKPQVVLATRAGCDGTDGGWTVLDGNAPADTTQVWLAIDEDQLRNNERGHTTEQNGIVAFETVVTTPAPEDSPIVALIVADPSNPTNEDTARASMIGSFGYIVRMVDDSAGTAGITAAIADCDAVYVSDTANSGAIENALLTTTLGIVIENPQLARDLELTNSVSPTTATQIDIVVSDHFVTSAIGSGEVAVFSSSDRMYHANSGASGAIALAERAGGPSNPMMLTIEPGAILRDGSAAMGRRIMLPWGDGSFDPDDLSAIGRTLTQRAILWTSRTGLTGGAGSGGAGGTITRLAE